MKNNGFTLIELLAVIVILAIIALIATPIILNIIESTKTSAVVRSAELYLDAVEQAVARKNLTEPFKPETCTVENNGNLTCNETSVTVETTGDRPTSGTLTFIDGDITKVEDMALSGYVVETNENRELVIKGTTNPNVDIEKDNSGAEVSLLDGLTPVVYDDEKGNWKVVLSSDPSWYNYEKQQWANAVILKSGVTKNPGETVTVEGSNPEALAMFVWIPRYEYKIGGQYGKGSTSKATPGEIEVNFISKETTEPTEGYIIHPAFWWNNDGDEVRDPGEELTGIWVGKFETTGSESAPTILPNVQSIRNQAVGKQFETAQSFNTLYLGSNASIDTHMAKNSEWGAVAYLSQSKYGKYGNEEFDSTQKEIYINNSMNRYTGRSGGNAGGKVATEKDTYGQGSAIQYNNYGYYTYDGYLLTYGTNAKSSTRDILKGTGASTTGNIYGVYDMSGGAFEYVMGYYTPAYESGSSKGLPWGSTSTENKAEFKSELANKYYDAYANDEKFYGHALSETSDWYGDNSYFVSLSDPWFLRGGSYNIGASAGVFNSNYYSGSNSGYYAFRVVLAETDL